MSKEIIINGKKCYIGVIETGRRSGKMALAEAIKKAIQEQEAKNETEERKDENGRKGV